MKTIDVYLCQLQSISLDIRIQQFVGSESILDTILLVLNSSVAILNCLSVQIFSSLTSLPANHVSLKLFEEFNIQTRISINLIHARRRHTATLINTKLGYKIYWRVWI